MEIVVIGVEPPCIRCHTTFKRAKEVAQQFSQKIEVKKVTIHTKEAEKYGNVEAGHGIEVAGNVKPDIEKHEETDRGTGDIESQRSKK